MALMWKTGARYGLDSTDSSIVNGNLEAGQCLLDHGADINARDHLGQTPLFKAVLKGHVEFARMLLINKTRGKHQRP
jgi:ankyrin repeat protein